MRDYLSIGSSPTDEPCANVGEPDYHTRAREECKRFIQLIRAKCGEEPPGASLVTKSFPHDFGAYMEVCVSYDDQDEEAVEYAYFCESNTPENWEDSAPIRNMCLNNEKTE